VHETVDGVAQCGVEERLGSAHVGAYERVRAGDGTVHMGFRGEVDHLVGPGHDPVDDLGVADVALDEGQPGVGEVEVVEPAGIGELVEHGDVGDVCRRLHAVGREQHACVLGPDETGGAGDQEMHQSSRKLANPGFRRYSRAVAMTYWP
jgi:hypothetical protein